MMIMFSVLRIIFFTDSCFFYYYLIGIGNYLLEVKKKKKKKKQEQKQKYPLIKRIRMTTLATISLKYIVM